MSYRIAHNGWEMILKDRHQLSSVLQQILKQGTNPTELVITASTGSDPLTCHYDPGVTGRYPVWNVTTGDGRWVTSFSAINDT